MSNPYFWATAMERLSGGLPIWYPAVPAESTNTLSESTLERKIPSANGDLQIFPKQTIKTLVFINYGYKMLGELFVQIVDILSELFVGFSKIVHCFASVEHGGVVTLPDL